MDFDKFQLINSTVTGNNGTGVILWRSDSPARDQGVAAGPSRDMDGELRPHPDTGIPNIGADEYHLDDLRIYLPLVLRN